LEQTGDSSDRIRLGPTRPALHWRHLHQQGSAACIIFLQAFAGRGSMPLAALCCSPLSTCCPLPRQRRRGRAREPEKPEAEAEPEECWTGEKALSCVALSQIPPLQHHTLSALRMPKICTGKAAAQWATGSRRSSFVRGLQADDSHLTLAGVAMAPALHKFSSAFQGPRSREV
jgi:hypothetical protein